MKRYRLLVNCTPILLFRISLIPYSTFSNSNGMVSHKYWVHPIRIFRHQSICLLFLQLVVAAVALNPLCIVSEACINYIFCGTLKISNEARNWFAGNNEDVWATHLPEQWIGKFSVMVIGGWETFPTT